MQFFYSILSSTLFRLVVAVVVGLFIGSIANITTMNIVVVIRHILGQLLLFMVPLIVLAYVSSAIISMGTKSSQMLALAITLAYLSSIGAAFMAMGIGYSLLPRMAIESVSEVGRELPKLIFELNFPPIMSVMSALLLAIMMGLAVVWSKANNLGKIINESQKMVYLLIRRVLIPILPIFVAVNFCVLSYEGVLSRQFPLLLNVLLLTIAAHFVWLTILYSIAALVTQKNPFDVVRHYAPPYLTALGTMSSAATLPIALKVAKKSTILTERCVDFSIPLFSNIHLCGSILTEVLFIMVTSQILYGSLPAPATLAIFILLLAIFAIGAPGVPGGTVIASLGIVTSILGFDSSATALLLTIFALQDSFGTACNVLGDGALTIIMNHFTVQQHALESAEMQ